MKKNKFLIKFSLRAEKEITESFEYYEKAKHKLGQDFINEIKNLLFQIEINPFLFQVKIKGFREAKINRFPYLIIYKINLKEKCINVTSVFNAKRNPKSKYKN